MPKSIARDKTVSEQRSSYRYDTDFSELQVLTEDNLTSEASNDIGSSRTRALAKLGFRFGNNGAHAARTMMFDELSLLLDRLPAEATRADYVREIVGLNCLAKQTQKSRELTLRHLTALYALDPSVPIFRIFRKFWDVDKDAQPVLALTMVLVRDPLLRQSQQFILGKPLGELVERKELEELLGNDNPDRFSPASLKSIAQNLNGTWTRGGYLHGKVRKSRSAPVVKPTNVAFALFLGYLEGLSGQRLFKSTWAVALVSSFDELVSMASSGSNRGLLVFMNAGGVIEVRFPGYLTSEEEKWLHE